MPVSRLSGLQKGFPSILKVPPVALVATHTAYLVLLRMPQAVTGAQHLLVNGYSSVPVPMVNTTGAVIVVATGIDWAITTQ
jgi:hypothetical protein